MSITSEYLFNVSNLFIYDLDNVHKTLIGPRNPNHEVELDDLSLMNKDKLMKTLDDLSRHAIDRILNKNPIKKIIHDALRMLTKCFDSPLEETEKTQFIRQFRALEDEAFQVFQSSKRSRNLIQTHNLNKIENKEDKDFIEYSPGKIVEEINGQMIETDYFPFYKPNGLCKGEAFWFIYLFLKTQDAFKGRSMDDHIIAVSKEFAQGGPIATALLQNFPRIEIRDMLCLHKDITKTISYSNVSEKSEETFDNEFNSLPQGIYYFGYHSNGENRGHAIVYIKKDDENAYLIDLNMGPRKIEGRNLGERIRHYFPHDKPVSIELDLTRHVILRPEECE